MAKIITPGGKDYVQVCAFEKSRQRHRNLGCISHGMTWPPHLQFATYATVQYWNTYATA